MPEDDSRDAISFVEKLLVLLDEGMFTATYKYAVLLALIDLCMERSDPDGGPPSRIPTGAFAEKVVELYWPHSNLFRGTDGAVVLRQNSGGQAEILSMIARLRDQVGPSTAMTFGQARIANPDAVAALIRDVEWKLVEMPLPRLQQFGTGYDPFLYDIDWTTDTRRSDFVDGVHDFAVHVRPSVGDNLVRLNGLIRPLIQRHWTDMVARFNRHAIEDTKLEEFLFGVPRRPTGSLVDGLRHLQANRCFYCERTLQRAAEIDHFIPWARHPDDAIHNLVLAHRACNNAKRDFLAADPHVAHWSTRFDEAIDRQLQQLAAEQRWTSHRDTSHNVARAIYLRLPDDAKLWVHNGEFVPFRRPAIEASLAAAASPLLDMAAERSLPFDGRGSGGTGRE